LDKEHVLWLLFDELSSQKETFGDEFLALFFWTSFFFVGFPPLLTEAIFSSEEIWSRSGMPSVEGVQSIDRSVNFGVWSSGEGNLWEGLRKGVVGNEFNVPSVEVVHTIWRSDSGVGWRGVVFTERSDEWGVVFTMDEFCFELFRFAIALLVDAEGSVWSGSGCRTTDLGDSSIVGGGFVFNFFSFEDWLIPVA
jgi:hypothetical protein